MTGGLCLRLARQGEEEAIVQFLDAHWERKLPLVHVPEFFEFYYRPLGAAPQFALAEQGGRICAAAGFIRANACESPDIWASIWAADEAAPGAGMELMAALPRLANARFCAVNNRCPKRALRCAACPVRRPCRACSACSRSFARSKTTGIFLAAILPTPSKAMTCGQARRAGTFCARARCP